MKYYMTAVKHIKKDDTESRECFSMTDLISAKATALSKMAAAMNDANCDYAFAVIMNNLGQNLMQPISFVRPEEESEEEE